MKKMKYLTNEDKKILLQEVYKTKGKHRLRNIAIFEVALYCALRVSEICTLRLDSYDKTNHSIYCHRLKGSSSNTLKIVDSHVIKALDDYMEERLQMKFDSDYLFLSQKGTPISRQRLDALIKKYCKAAHYIHPDKWHMHVLKHTRAVDLAELQLDIDDIQFWLGHKNVQNTFKYLEYTTALRKHLFDKLSVAESGSYDDRYSSNNLL